MRDQAERLREIVRASEDDNACIEGVAGKIPGKIVAVTSGKGGVGKTNVAVNLAVSIAKRGRRVVLVDLDLGLANADVVLDVRAPHNLEDVVSGKKKVHEIIVPGPGGIDLVPGGSGVPRLAALTDIQREYFLSNVYSLTGIYDYIIFDTAAGISTDVLNFIVAADEVVVVTTEEPTAITDAYALMKVAKGKRDDVALSLLINMVKSGQQARTLYSRIKEVAHQFLHIDLPCMGMIPFDRCVRESVMKRKAFVLAYPFSPATVALKQMAQKIVLADVRSYRAVATWRDRIAMLMHA